jgi:hypothetical protein
MTEKTPLMTHLIELRARVMRIGVVWLLRLEPQTLLLRATSRSLKNRTLCPLRINPLLSLRPTS